uniref:Uncharacterized protein n=1 Tax=Acrobeloides nanus TaxID=290746 RepID=A0A914CGR2_9BILA
MAEIELLKTNVPYHVQHVMGSDMVIEELPEAVDERKFYFVSESLFENILQTRYKNGIRCTQKEVDEINESLGGTDLTVKDFLFERPIFCDCCNRQINFYDVFQQATKKHGVDFLRWAILGDGKKVQIFPKNFEHQIECSKCHSMVVAVPYGHYSSRGYACA